MIAFLKRRFAMRPMSTREAGRIGAAKRKALSQPAHDRILAVACQLRREAGLPDHPALTGKAA